MDMSWYVFCPVMVGKFNTKDWLNTTQLFKIYPHYNTRITPFGHRLLLCLIWTRRPICDSSSAILSQLSRPRGRGRRLRHHALRGLLQCLGRTRITQFHRKEIASLWMESGVAWHNPEEKGTLFISVFCFFLRGGVRGNWHWFLFTPPPETWIFVRFRADFFPFWVAATSLGNHMKIMSTVELSN